MKSLSEAITITPDRSLLQFQNDLDKKNEELFNSYLYNEGPKSALSVAEIKPESSLLNLNNLIIKFKKIKA